MDESASWVKLYRTPLPVQNSPTGSSEQLLISKHRLARIWICDPAVINTWRSRHSMPAPFQPMNPAAAWKKELASG